eukprot:6069177-Alexandrium_andersonii.AAC.1
MSLRPVLSSSAACLMTTSRRGVLLRPIRRAFWLATCPPVVLLVPCLAGLPKGPMPFVPCPRP